MYGEQVQSSSGEPVLVLRQGQLPGHEQLLQFINLVPHISPGRQEFRGPAGTSSTTTRTGPKMSSRARTWPRLLVTMEST